MDKSLRTYLEWRFRMYNTNGYQRYRDEWINNLIPVQLEYFKKEMKHLIENGKYK